MAYQPGQISDLVNRPPRDIWVKDSSAKDLLDMVQSHPERRLRIPSGTYALGAQGLKPTIGNGNILFIKGSGRNNTIITCSDTAVFDAQDGGLTSGIVQMEDLQIVHTAPAAGSPVGLDFTNVIPILKNVLLTNNGTLAGSTGIKLSPISNSPHPYLERVDSLYYDVNFYLDQDHIEMHNCVASGDGAKHYNIFHGFHMLLNNPHTYAGTVTATGHAFYSDNGGASILIVNPYFEPHHANQTGAMFSGNAGGHPIAVVNPVIWPDAANFANIPLCDISLQMYKFITFKSDTTLAKNKFMEYNGYSTGTGAQQTIPHNCAFTPTYSEVFLSERSTGGALAYQTAAPDATNIYVTATLNKDYNWKVKPAVW